MKERRMHAAATQSPKPETVRAFIQAYFDAWKGTDEEKILDFFSPDVILYVPTGKLEGVTAVRDGFVHPVVTGFPGNVHSIRNLATTTNLAAVEWNFDAVHAGVFGGVEATNRKIHLPGSSFYEHDIELNKIVAGRIYFDFGELLRQIGVAA
jgi:predicted ester cyclase